MKPEYRTSGSVCHHGACKSYFDRLDFDPVAEVVLPFTLLRGFAAVEEGPLFEGFLAVFGFGFVGVDVAGGFPSWLMTPATPPNTAPTAAPSGPSKDPAAAPAATLAIVPKSFPSTFEVILFAILHSISVFDV